MERLLYLAVGLGLLAALVAPGHRQPDPAPPQTASTVTVAAPVAEPSATVPAFGETEIRRDDNGHFTVDARVNGQTTRFLVDTGADSIALTVDEARRLGLYVDPNGFTPVAIGASGEVRGQRVELAEIEVAGRRIEHPEALVLEGLPTNLLGQSVLQKLGGVELSGDRMVLR